MKKKSMIAQPNPTFVVQIGLPDDEPADDIHGAQSVTALLKRMILNQEEILQELRSKSGGRWPWSKKTD